MHNIAVFRAERDAGLEQRIRSGGRLTLAAARLRSGPVPAGARPRTAPAFCAGSSNDADLHYIDAVLVTTGWNNNDDVFDRVETWAARHSPEDKQLNYEHDHSKIVGHIVSNAAVRVGAGDAAVGEAIADDTVVDDLPQKFHLVTGAVLYKHWQTPELQEQMDDILALIAKGGLRVSMECVFAGFDYAMRSPDGSTKVVARNEKTAFLTKHLRAYGGTGRFGEDRVGRVLRNIVFSGKGLVKNPANPESVILSSPPDSATASQSAGLTLVQCAIATSFGWAPEE